MDQQTDLELPDDFFRTDNGQRGEKIAKNFARTSVRGVGGMRGALKSAAPLSVPRRVKTICFIYGIKCCSNML